MNLLQMVSSPRVNGAVMHTARFARLLQAHGHQVVIAAPPGSWIQQELGDSFTYLPTRFERTRAEVRRVADACRTHAIHATHSHATRAHHFGLALAPYSGVPHLAHMHSNGWRLHWLRQQHVLVLSQADARLMRRLYFRHDEQVAVLPNYVDTERFAPPATAINALANTFGLPPGIPILACVAEIIPRKGQLHLVRALAGVRAQHPAVRLILFGREDKKPAYAQAVRDEARRLGVADAIIWAGFRRDVPDLLPHATVSILPSLAEPFALGGLESMACGLPVVATTVGGFPEMIESGQSGLLVPPSDYAALARTLSELLADSARRAALGQAARTRVLRDFTAAAHLQRYEHLLSRWGVVTATG